MYPSSIKGFKTGYVFNNKTTEHIRKNNTWSLRKVGQDISQRPFGGLNLVVSGDAWQFGPIGSCGAVFDNPIRMQCVAANSIIAAMLTRIIINLQQRKALRELQKRISFLQSKVTQTPPAEGLLLRCYIITGFLDCIHLCFGLTASTP